MKSPGVLFSFIRYNIKIVFGNRFIYFLLAALIFYITIAVSLIFNDDDLSESKTYMSMFVPALLLIFYPSGFGIQNDQDCKIIEVLFGIPNYRYKIWLSRLLIAFAVCFIFIMGLTFLTNLLIIEINPFEMAGQIMMPTLFIGTISFMFSSIIRNGNGTAVVMLIIGAILFAINNSIQISIWNVFINPYEIPEGHNPVLFYDTLFYNRVIISLCSIVFVTLGLNNMRKREKFI